jgi:COMPASS component SWD2
VNHYQKILLYDMKNFDKEPFATFTIKDPALDKISYPPRHPIITSMSFSTNGKWLLVGTAGDAHYVMDAFDGRTLAKLEGHVGLERGKFSKSVGVTPVKGISGEEVNWTQDSLFVVGGSQAGKIHFWDASQIPEAEVPDGEDVKILSPIVNLDGHPGPSRCVRFNPRLQMMVTAGPELVTWISCFCLTVSLT